MLSENEIKAELSYAYLHAVAARAGFGCHPADRHLDGSGVDAQINVKERLAAESIYTEFSFHFQLKATSQELALVEERISFPLDVAQYDKLRKPTLHMPRFMLVLQLPATVEDWLTVSPDELVTRRCARWVSLRGAPTTASTAKTTVRIPVDNLLTPHALRDIARRCSVGEEIDYAG